MTHDSLPPDDEMVVLRKRLIDKICDRFESAWKRGEHPRLEQYLNQGSGSVRLELFQELVHLDLEFRQKEGENPTVADYEVIVPGSRTMIEVIFLKANDDSPLSEDHSRVDQKAFPSTNRGHFSKRGKTRFLRGESTILQSFGSFDLRTSFFRRTFENPETQPSCSPLDKSLFLGQYELLEKVGTGGMGVVYKARQHGADRVVALKVIRPDHLEDFPAAKRRELMDRFRLEAKTAARVHHENVATIFDVGESEGTLYYSMRFIEGQSLAEMVRDGPMDCRRAARFMAKTAKALHAVHQTGVIHRDVKPRNILVDQGDEPFLTDFGLARLAEASRIITQSGDWVGTPCYMSPEQAQNSAAASPASDVYSLGATLYHLITSGPPFRAAEVWMTLQWILTEDPTPPRRLNHSVDRDLELICLKCLEKVPGRRYASAGEMAEELDRYLHGEGLAITRPIPRSEQISRWARRRPGKAVAAVFGVALCLLVALFTTVFVSQRSQATANLEAAFKESNRQVAYGTFDRGIELCSHGDVGSGVLWQAQALDLALRNAPELEGSTRLSVGAWQDRLQRLRWWIPDTGVKGIMVLSSSEKQLLAVGPPNTVQILDMLTGLPLAPPLAHDLSVVAAAISSNGKSICTASAGGKVWLWRLTNGKVSGQQLNGTNSVRALAISPDGSTVLTGGIDNTARLWQTVDGAPLGTVGKHQREVNKVAFSPDGKTALTVSKDNSARLWDIKTGQSVGQSLFHPGAILAAVFSPDGKMVATGGKDKMARIWDAGSGKILAILPHEGEVSVIVFHPHSQIVLTGSADRTARLWSLPKGVALSNPLIHSGRVQSAAFSPDGSFFITGASDGWARLFDASSGRSLGPLFHQSPFDVMVILKDSRTILTGGQSQGIRLWTLALPLKPKTILTHENSVYAATFSPDGRAILTGSYDATAQYWDSDSGRQLISSLKTQGRVLGVAISPDGNMLMTRCFHGPAQLWKAKTGHLLCTLGHPGWVLAFGFSPDGTKVITAGDDHTARVWESSTGKALGAPLVHPEVVNLVSFSPDGTFIATSCHEGGVRFWDSITMAPVGSVLKHGSRITALVFSPNGEKLVTAGNDSFARIWDCRGGRQVGNGLQHRGPITGLTISPDGSTLLTASEDCTVQKWNLNSGAPLGPPWEHSDRVLCVTFSSDGRLAATGCGDGTIRLWDPGVGRVIGPWLPHDGEVDFVGFCPRGKLLLAGGRGKKVSIWEVSQSCSTDAKELSRQLEIAMGMGISREGTIQALSHQEWQDSRLRGKN